jgi:hypothetical protein
LISVVIYLAFLSRKNINVRLVPWLNLKNVRPCGKLQKLGSTTSRAPYRFHSAKRPKEKKHLQSSSSLPYLMANYNEQRLISIIVNTLLLQLPLVMSLSLFKIKEEGNTTSTKTSSTTTWRMTTSRYDDIKHDNVKIILLLDFDWQSTTT